MEIVLIIFKFGYLSGLLGLLFLLLFATTSHRRLLSMIMLLVNFALLLIFIHFEYVAFIIIILYVGAISVLFLFVIMFINFSKEPVTLSFVLVPFVFGSFLLIFLGFLFVVDFSLVSGSLDYFLNQHQGFGYLFIPRFINGFFLDQFHTLVFFFNSEIEQLGFVLWTVYLFLVMLSGFVLIVSIFGCVSILKSIFLFNIYKKKLLSVFSQDKPKSINGRG